MGGRHGLEAIERIAARTRDPETLRDLEEIAAELRAVERERDILARVAEISQHGAFVYDVQAQQLEWSSPGLARLFDGAADWRSLVHPEDLPILDAYMFERGDTLEVVPFRLRTQHGERHAIARRGVLDRDPRGEVRTIIGVVEDVTDLRLADKRALANLTAIIDALPLGLLVRRDGKLIYVNEAFASMLGRDREALVGVEPPEFIDERDHSLVAARAQEVARGIAAPPVELRLRGAHGPVLVEGDGLEIDYDGGRAVLVHYRDITEERAARALIETSLREKEALLREIHHRVKNNLSVVASMLFIQARGSSDPVLRGALEASMARVRSIALVHEQLYRTKDFARIDLIAYLRPLVSEVISTLGGHERGIRVEVSGEAVEIDLDQAMPCGLIVNELLTNAIKHAFPARVGSIAVRASVHGERVRVEVADDGVGYDPKTCSRAGLGRQLIEDLCVQIDATSRSSVANGTVFAFEFERKT